MSFLQKIIGYVSGNGVEVDSNNNMKVNPPTTTTQAGFVTNVNEADAGVVSATRLMRKMRSSHEERLSVGEDLVLFSEGFITTGTTDSRNVWANLNSSMTKGVLSGMVQLNQGLSVTSGHYSIFTSCRSFTVMDQYTYLFRSMLSFKELPQTNNMCEWGFQSFDRTTTPSATVDGIFFRLNSGTFQAVVSYNTSEQSVAIADFATLVNTDTVRKFEISVKNTQALFFIDEVLVATINTGATQSQLSQAGGYFASFRVWNSGAVSTAQLMNVGTTSVIMKDAPPTKPWSHVMAGLGRGAYQVPNTGSNNATSTNYTNSLAIAAGNALTNTTAAAGTGLGGQFTVLPTLTAGTDGILCSYLNLASSAGAAGRNLYITGVNLKGIVTTVFNGGPVYYLSALAFGSNALSAATADSGSSAKGPRKIPLGIETYVVTAPVGTLGQGVSIKLDTPALVCPNEYVQILLKNIGTVTTTGAITFLVSFDGYWE